MKNKLKVFLIIVLILFITCTISTVLKNTSVPKAGSSDILSVSKTVSVTTRNELNVSDAFLVDFKDYNSKLVYKIPLQEDNYDIEVSRFDFISSSSGDRVKANLAKIDNDIVVTVSNNGYVGKDNILLTYTIDKGEDFDDEKDSFNLTMFDTSLGPNVKELTFNVTFPKVVNEEKVYLLAGNVISNDEFDVNVNGNIVSGHFLAQGNQALYKDTELNIEFEEGYFKGQRNNIVISNGITIIYLIITIIFLCLWFFKGKDESIIPSPTFYTPDEYSPLEIGYWIDGNVDYQDIFFLLIHWANEGYIKVTKLSKAEQTEGKNNFIFKKIRELDINKPEYEKMLFNAIFTLGENENTNGEFNTKVFREETDALYGTLQTYAQDVGNAEEEFNKMISKNEFESYDESAEQLFGFMKFASLMLWIIAMYLYTVPNAVNLSDYMPLFTVFITVLMTLFISKDAFFLYIIYTSPILLLVSFASVDFKVLILIILDLFLTAIVRKRTFKYNDILGKIYGFRNVMSKYKYRSQINDIARNHSNYFYDVLPYALVLYKADKWADQFDNIETPDWYSSLDGEGLSKSNIKEFNKDLIVLCEDILSIVNLSATADKKKVSREGLTYVSKSERIRNAGLNPSDFENDDE